ncbi:maleylpyruvate isomerase N-terminal domain-containing protein [Pseudonocardia sp. EC080619-01]|uniref:maleylpyruvate isomerase N-terminal domain-containing protein n=1 Tax=Pseudonocardia sp. EC080619-01 TaxID=1096856 RepID=UPI0009E6812F|nr:maleylpyruvate isomerase N-terminal domain-containing protein [Pseudonocardia sp. EC080619-01]
MDVPEIYAWCTAAFAVQVHLVGTRWTAPSGLPGWDVRAVVNHLVNEQRWTPELFAGATIDSVGDRFDSDLLGDDPVSMFDHTAAMALDSAPHSLAEIPSCASTDVTVGPIRATMLVSM